MRTFTIALLVVVAATCISAEGDNNDGFKKAQEECRKQAGLDAKNDKKGQDDPKAKCVNNCVAKKLGLVGPDDKFKPDKVAQFMQKRETSKDLIEVAKKCIATANNVADKCERANKAHQCMKTGAKGGKVRKSGKEDNDDQGENQDGDN